MRTLALITLLLTLSACHYDDPDWVVEERACAEHVKQKAERAGESVPSTSDARQACEDFIKENPFTKPWEAEGGS